MARVEGIPPNTPAWDGRTGIPVPPEAAHVLKDRGIEVFRRNVTNRDRIRNGVPAEWMRKDAAPFLQEVQDGGSGGFAEQPRWVWCAPTAVAILVRGGRESGWESTHDDHLAVALWAVDNAGFKALDALYRLSEGTADYLVQVRAMYEQRNQTEVNNERIAD